MADRLACAKRPVIETQGLNGRRDCQGCAPVGRTQIGTEATPAELPLFAAALQAEEEQCDTLRERLKTLDLDSLSPREALDVLYDLKREAEA